MGLFDKPLEQVTEEDLQGLIDGKIRECVYLDYKSKTYGNNDSAKKEFLKDVSAFANARGGYLLIGITEKYGYPREILGIDNVDDEAAASISLCSSCIQERIQGLKVHPVPLDNGKHVLVVEVPRSIRRPHMISFSKHSSFWKRQSDQNVSMNIDDIRDAFIAGNNMMNRVEEIIKNQREILDKIDNPGVIIQYIILPIYIEGNLVDTSQPAVRDAIINYGSNNLVHFKCNCANVHPFMYGLESIEYRSRRGDYYFKIQVYQNGLVTSVIRDEAITPGRTAADEAPVHYLHGRILADNLINNIEVANKIYNIASLNGPFIVTVTIHGRNKLRMYRNEGFFQHNMSELYESAQLNLPSVQLSDLTMPERAAKEVLDLLWRCYHLDECDYYDENGNYITKKR